MSYLWQEFNIKTFIAETLVFRNGVFCEELSDYKSAVFKNNTITINKESDLPIHIIYVGEIDGDIDFNIDIIAGNNNVIMTNKISNKKPAFLNIFVKNAGKKSVFNGKIIVKNKNSLKIRVTTQHLCENTGIFMNTKVVAYKNTETDLAGSAIIEKNVPHCDSDVSFMVMADDNAKIILKPMQYIKSVPTSAKHSAALYKPNENQITYLRMSGLSGAEIKEVLENAFLEQL